MAVSLALGLEERDWIMFFTSKELSDLPVKVERVAQHEADEVLGILQQLVWDQWICILSGSQVSVIFLDGKAAGLLTEKKDNRVVWTWQETRLEEIITRTTLFRGSVIQKIIRPGYDMKLAEHYNRKPLSKCDQGLPSGEILFLHGTVRFGDVSPEGKLIEGPGQIDFVSSYSNPHMGVLLKKKGQKPVFFM